MNQLQTLHRVGAVAILSLTAAGLAACGENQPVRTAAESSLAKPATLRTTSVEFFDRLSRAAFANVDIDWGTVTSLDRFEKDGAVVAGVVVSVEDGGVGPWIVGSGPSTGTDEQRLRVTLRDDHGGETSLLLPAGTRPPEGSGAKWPVPVDDLVAAAPIGDRWIAVTYRVGDDRASSTVMAAGIDGKAASFGAPVSTGTTFGQLWTAHRSATGSA